MFTSVVLAGTGSGQAEKDLPKSGQAPAHIILVQKYQAMMNAQETLQLAKMDLKNIPLYFRADLLRMMATLHEIEQCTKECYFVYADWDVVPMNQAELFDHETIENLKKFGMVLQRGGYNHNMENSFHIVSNTKPNLIKAIKMAIVSANLHRAANKLNNEYAPGPDFAQSIYDSIPGMFRYFYHLEGLGEIEVKTSSGYEKYDANRHGFTPFNTQKHPQTGDDSLGENWRFIPKDKTIIHVDEIDYSVLEGFELQEGEYSEEDIASAQTWEPSGE